ncbi:acyl-CoA synthetase [Paraburkholderia humisilvae]|uniref:Acetyl-coenzyme A synthetase n=1 Tax=Paraburkholderia humisilvae TaxID=627669 RepID=A0A6J5F467_9BURK|nr:acyl-CoA synthetase [Paraburkholderia humisilvae]CAB3773143.1 Acetyl-coenzyme A synthetase [Paraburkholderia humisilvae]
MLACFETYEQTTSRFEWRIPEEYNIGVDACDKWADGSGRVALVCESQDGRIARYTFDELKRWSDGFAHALRRDGVQKADRIGIFMSQSVETAIAHLAVYKCGAIAVPLFALFGPDALQYRLADSGAVALVTDPAGLQKIGPLRDTLPDLRVVYCVDNEPDRMAHAHAHQRTAQRDAHVDAAEQEKSAATMAPVVAATGDVRPFWTTMSSESEPFDVPATSADDPAVIIYTSGTTGKPKGALHAHRVLLGHLPGVEMSQGFFPVGAKLMWTPADWAWIGGLFDVLLPSLHHGIAVLARRFEKFDPQAAFDLMQRHEVTHAFLPPTALKMMRTVEHPQRWRFALRAVASGGESLGAELIEWGERVFGVTINEFYGQTECNVVLSSCATLFAPRAGWIGKAAPGHQVAIVDETGRPVPAGTQGDIAVRVPDPVMFIGYWCNDAATRDKYRGEWLVTGDTGVADDEGFIRFVGRDDDVITSASYRIGPAPIEDCLLRHPAVRMAAVVGTPDPERTQTVTAFIVLNSGYAPDDTLRADLQQHVKTRLAAHEYPRIIHFVDDLPLTATGKMIRRELREYAARMAFATPPDNAVP